MIDWNIHPSAQQEYEEALLHFRAIDERLVIVFETCYREYFHSILSNPHLYNLRQHSSRRVNLQPRFGESYIACMIWEEKVVIFAVAHAKRRPCYWRDRISEAKEIF
jgi:hypothetical protein